MNDQQKPRQVDGYMCEEFDGETFLYHPEQTQAIYLNQVAAVIWRLCDGEKSVGDIRELLQDAFPEQSAQVAQDFHDALEHFVSIGSIGLE